VFPFPSASAAADIAINTMAMITERILFIVFSSLHFYRISSSVIRECALFLSDRTILSPFDLRNIELPSFCFFDSDSVLYPATKSALIYRQFCLYAALCLYRFRNPYQPIRLKRKHLIAFRCQRYIALFDAASYAPMFHGL
jgi:hypothetical protein